MHRSLVSLKKRLPTSMPRALFLFFLTSYLPVPLAREMTQMVYGGHLCSLGKEQVMRDDALSVIHVQVVGEASIANAMEQNTSCDSRRVARSSKSLWATAFKLRNTLWVNKRRWQWFGVTHLTSKNSGSEVVTRLIIWSTHGELLLQTMRRVVMIAQSSTPKSTT